MPATATSKPYSTQELLERACAAAPRMALLSSAEKNAILSEMGKRILASTDRILAANRSDVDDSGLEGSMLDRLTLTPARVTSIAEAVRDVAALEDPVGRVLAEWTRPNGLRIARISVPLGVVGVIYEARPNVTVDAAVLAIKAGNAVVLRGGREAARCNRVLAEILSATRGLPEGAIALLDSSSRESTEQLVRARGLVDVIVPRGSAGLISYVAENSSIPVIETGAGNCHIYVDAGADLNMAEEIVFNAKTQRPSVCNAAEKLLVHISVAGEFLPHMISRLRDAGVEVRGDEQTCALASGVRPAEAADWPEEYLDLRICIGVVEDVQAAIAHINRYSTKHSEAIITRDEPRANEFLRAVDSAAVYWNASTRFTDGAEFGFGAEMGISTQKLHCRGPFALAELTSSKYQIVGTGQVRK
jgi:glutamate-5-semialdehyde dehydrogenase